MNPNQLKQVIQSDIKYILQKPTDEEFELLKEIMTDSELKNKLLNKDSLSFENILSRVLSNKDGINNKTKKTKTSN